MTEDQRDGAEADAGVLEPRHGGLVEPDRAAAPRPVSVNRSLVVSVFARYRLELQRYLMRRLRNPEDVDDLAQIVYIRVMQIDEEKIIQKPLAYIYTIASHVLAEHRRRAADHKGEHILLDFDSVDELSDEPSCVLPDDSAERLNLQQQIALALAQLPPTHAAVLLLHKRDGMTYAEVAEQLNLSIHTVEKYVTQAKARIRTMTWER